MANTSLLLELSDQIQHQGYKNDKNNGSCAREAMSASMGLYSRKQSATGLYEHETSTLDNSSVSLPLLPVMRTAKCPAIVKKKLENSTVSTYGTSVGLQVLPQQHSDSFEHSEGPLVNSSVPASYVHGVHPRSAKRASLTSTGSLLNQPCLVDSSNVGESRNNSTLNNATEQKEDASEENMDVEIEHSLSGNKQTKGKKKKKKKKHKNRPKTSTCVTHIESHNSPAQTIITNDNCQPLAKPLKLSVKAKPIFVSKQEEYSNKLKQNFTKETISATFKPKLGLIKKLSGGISASFDETVLVYNQNSNRRATTDGALNINYIKSKNKVIKVYLSEKQSRSLKELGVDIPCAPPATPRPDSGTSIHCEYVPSLSDIRAQRALKGRLEVIQKIQKTKIEKEKEDRIKLEKLQGKEKEKELKRRQRQEIYALNKIMTELEHKNFQKFCKDHGINNSK